VVLHEAAIDAVADGSVAGVPVLLGTCLDEWKLFQFLDPSDVDADELERRMGKVFDDPAHAIEVYRAGNADAEPKDLFGATITDLVFRQPAHRLAEALVRNGSPTYSYLFTWPSPMGMGACHALEVPFVFGGDLTASGLGFLLGSNPPRHLVDVVQESWLAFARTGDPANDVVGEWPAYDLDRRPTMELAEQLRVLDDPERARRLLWSDVL